MVASGTVALLDAARPAAWSCPVATSHSGTPPSPVSTRPSSGAGMRLGMDRTEPLDRHVRVDLGGREASVAQQLLDGAEVGAALEDVRGRRVPEAVRADVGRTR